MQLDSNPLVESIYEAAIIPERWPIVLESLSRLANAVGATLFAVDGTSRVSWVASDRIRHVMETFVSKFAATNVRPQRALAKRYAGFMADAEFISAEDKAKEVMYTDLLKPNGLAWACGTVVPMPSKDLLVVDIERTDAAGPFSADTLRLLDQFRPHLSRAGVMASRLQLERATGATELLQNLGLPAAVLGVKGRVVAMNQLLQGLSSQVFVRAFDRITLAHSPASELLQQALENIEAERADVRSIAVPASEEAPGLVGHVLPIRRHAHDIFNSALALFVATPLVGPPPPNAGLLCGLFDLTPAEDRVARAFAEGHSIQSSAVALSVSQETIRTQLKRVLAKTGTSKQSELVRLLAGTTTIPIRLN